MHTHATRQSKPNLHNPNLHNPVYITYVILSVSSQSCKTALVTKLVMVFEWLELDFYQLVPNRNNFVLRTKVTNQ